MRLGSGGETKLTSRLGNEITAVYPDLQGVLVDALAGRAGVFDGELVVLGSDGRPSFQLMQFRHQRGPTAELLRTAVTYIVFDLLQLGEEVLLTTPYARRRTLLAELSVTSSRVAVPRHFTAEDIDPNELLAVVEEQGLEGLVAKRLESRYRAGQQRRRDAVARVATLQFDRHGNRIWREAKALLDSEHTRLAAREVVVPFGRCSEPSNVQAGGDHCPIRFRCVGCDHFNTDVSFLPDLRGYLADLLRNRERLRAMPEADAWAIAEAMPSEEEINRVRRLIRRAEDGLDELTPDDRAQIEEAVALVRKNRQVMLGLPGVRQPLPDIRPERPA
jgi:hypothetical protein